MERIGGHQDQLVAVDRYQGQWLDPGAESGGTHLGLQVGQQFLPERLQVRLK